MSYSDISPSLLQFQILKKKSSQKKQKKGLLCSTDNRLLFLGQPINLNNGICI